MARADGLRGPVPRSGSGRSGGSTGPGSPRSGGGSTGPGSRRPGGRRAPRRLRFLLAGVLLLFLLEIVVLIAVGQTIGPWWTIGLLLLFVVAGTVLVRRESGRTWKALRQALETGRMPGRELADASLVLVGGLLMLLPGFLSDLVGIFLILPVTRSVSRRLLAALVGSRMPTMVVPGTRPPGPESTARSGEDIIEGEIITEDPPPER